MWWDLKMEKMGLSIEATFLMEKTTNTFETSIQLII